MQRTRLLLGLPLVAFMLTSQAFTAHGPLRSPSWDLDDPNDVQLEASENELFCTQGIVVGPIFSFCCIDFEIEPDPGFDPANVCVICSAPPFNEYQWWMNNVGLHVEACGTRRECLEDPRILEFCVDGALPVEDTTWGRIKASYRDATK